MLSFQILSTRGKKVFEQKREGKGDQAVKSEDVKINVIIFCFDVLYLNDEVFLLFDGYREQCLIQKTLKERQEILRSTIPEKEGRFMYATHMHVWNTTLLKSIPQATDTEQIQSFLNESIAHGCEGLMLKTLTENAQYEPSKRSTNWLKVCLLLREVIVVVEERLHSRDW